MERPKRRKSKDNPYTIEERNGKYIVSFTDGEQKSIEVEVSKEIYECFDGFELDDLSQMNEYDRHTEHSDLTESTLQRRAANHNKSVEELVEGKMLNEKLYEGIRRLSKTQKRRLVKYYFDERSYTDIAREEGCDINPIIHSVAKGKGKIKDFLLNEFSDQNNDGQ